MDETKIQNLDDDALLALALEAVIEAEVAKKKADDFKDEIRRRYDGTKTAIRPSQPNAGFEVQLTYPRRFSEDLARDLLNDQELAQITVEKLDGKKAKELFGKDQYDLMTKSDTPRVGFKVL